MPATPAKSNAPDPIDVVVGLRLRNARKARGYLQADLAKALGVTFQQIQRYEHGRNRISVSTLIRAAAALDVAPEDLLPQPEDLLRFERTLNGRAHRPD